MRKSQQNITMTLIQTVWTNLITHCVRKQGVDSAEMGALVTNLEKIKCKTVI